MRVFFNLISIFIMISVIFLASLNSKLMLDFILWSPDGAKALTHHINLSSVMLLVLVAGILAGIFWASSFYLSNRGKLKEYQKKLEKTSVQSEEDSSKVAVLEGKIKVLEKALESALNKGEE